MTVTVARMEGEEERLSLIRAARADRAAFEPLMRQYERLVLVTALRLLGNMDDAQDASQEVFLRLYRNLKKLEDIKLPVLPSRNDVTAHRIHEQRRRRQNSH